MLALVLQPPREPGFFGTAGTTMPASVVRMLGQLGDLRALEILHAATRTSDVSVRGAAIVSLAELGDERTIAPRPRGDRRVRRPASRRRRRGLRAALGAGALQGRRRARLRRSDRRDRHPPRRTRVQCRDHEAARSSRDRSPRPRAARRVDPRARPIAGARRARRRSLRPRSWPTPRSATSRRSPWRVRRRPNAMQVITHARGRPAHRRARPARLRASARSSAESAASAGDSLLARLAASKDGRERALGTFGRVALGDISVDVALDDADPRVRRAAAMASLARPSAQSVARAPAAARGRARRAHATGPRGRPARRATRTACSRRPGSSTAPSRAARMPRSRRSRSPDAPTSPSSARSDSSSPRRTPCCARTRRAASRSRALADASGRLATAYAYETDVTVRRAVVAALVARTGDATAPARRFDTRGRRPARPGRSGPPGGTARPLGHRSSARPALRERCRMAARHARRRRSARRRLRGVGRALGRRGRAGRLRRRRLRDRAGPSAGRFAARACAAAAFVQGFEAMSDSKRGTKVEAGPVSATPVSFEDGIKRLSGDRPDAREGRSPSRGVAPALRGGRRPLARVAGAPRLRAEARRGAARLRARRQAAHEGLRGPRRARVGVASGYASKLVVTPQATARPCDPLITPLRCEAR